MSLRVDTTRVVAQLTGPGSINETAGRWDIHGADLGHMFWHKGQLYMVFGDTYGPGGLNGKNWRSNAMARIADPDPHSGLLFESMISGPDGFARELIPSMKVSGVEKTVIPTHGISIDGRMYLHYMSVQRWGPRSGQWRVRYSGFAYSDDDGETWLTPDRAVWPAGTGFEQAALVQENGWLYNLGIPEGRFGGVRLRRVDPKRVLDSDAYRYWNGERWVADPAEAEQIVPAPVGELSVGWSETRRRWVMMYLDEHRQAVMIRTAARLTGPWSESRTVVTAEEYPGLYAPYIVPGSEIDGDLYYTLSQWGAYNVFLMHTTLGTSEPTKLAARNEQQATVDDSGPSATQ